jgi:DNA-3-methyladenine glycosylase
MRPKLDSTFYNKPAKELAQDLLGCYLVLSSRRHIVAKIIETEAYITGDSANHAFIGKTPRTKILFESPGTIYVYLIYGKYYCFNIVSGIPGEAVLIRGILIEKGDEKISIVGPGKVSIALGISRTDNGSSILDEKMYITNRIKKERIYTTKRVGISKNIDSLLRFYLYEPKKLGKK